MSEYIFRMPKDTPELTWEGLDAYLKRGRNTYRRKIGTTVTLRRWGDEAIALHLYDTALALLYPDGRVLFAEAGANDRHMATGYWLDLVARDNKLGSVYRDKWVRYLWGRFGDIDSGRKRPIAGQVFTRLKARAASDSADCAATGE